MTNSLIYPDWPAPDNIKAVSSARIGGFSAPPYNSFNLGSHVGDDPETVNKNRHYLAELAQLPESPRWLQQQHGTQLINSRDWQADIQADAIFSHTVNHVCTIMTADCLPILLCNKQGDFIAAIHAGWRSLAAGIINKTIARFNCDPQDIIAWLGPAIGPTQFEVGLDVYATFIRHSSQASQAFQQTDATHYLADIYCLAKQYLTACDVTAIFGGNFCTVTDSERFFSYRRDGITGRMASLIWISS